MKQSEVQAAIGSEVIVTGWFDFGRGSTTETKELMGKTCILMKQCKSGLLQLSHEGKLFSLSMHNVEVIDGS